MKAVNRKCRGCESGSLISGTVEAGAFIGVTWFRPAGGKREDRRRLSAIACRACGLVSVFLDDANRTRLDRAVRTHGLSALGDGGL